MSLALTLMTKRPSTKDCCLYYRSDPEIYDALRGTRSDEYHGRYCLHLFLVALKLYLVVGTVHTAP
jgi:hypothetical protein